MDNLKAFALDAKELIDALEEKEKVDKSGANHSEKEKARQRLKEAARKVKEQTNAILSPEVAKQQDLFLK